MLLYVFMFFYPTVEYLRRQFTSKDVQIPVVKNGLNCTTPLNHKLLRAVSVQPLHFQSPAGLVSRFVNASVAVLCILKLLHRRSFCHCLSVLLSVSLSVCMSVFVPLFLSVSVSLLVRLGIKSLSFSVSQISWEETKHTDSFLVDVNLVKLKDSVPVLSRTLFSSKFVGSVLPDTTPSIHPSNSCFVMFHI